MGLSFGHDGATVTRVRVTHSALQRSTYCMYTPYGTEDQNIYMFFGDRLYVEGANRHNTHRFPTSTPPDIFLTQVAHVDTASRTAGAENSLTLA